MPFKCLTENDKVLIDRYIEQFGPGYDDAIAERNKNLEYILKPWADAKKDFLFKLFGGRLIIEKEVDIEKDVDMLESEMEEAFTHNEAFIRFKNDFYRVVDEFSTVGSNDWFNIKAFVYPSILASNLYDYSWRAFEFELPGLPRPVKVNPGVKPMKILGKIADAYKLESFEPFRIAHSMILNKKSFKGTLCLSIHPMDYMTMSDNSMNWESCMNWQEPGDYRQGTVEMMNSPTVIVAYLKGGTPFEFCHGHFWNNKRWRSLFVVNEYFNVDVKGYPYQSSELKELVRDMLFNLAKDNCGIEYTHEYEYDGGDEEVILDHGERMHMRFDNGMMYSDFGCLGGKHHTIRATEDNPRDFWSEWPIYSGATECMWCGTTCTANDDFIDSSSVVCNDCVDAERCDHCGERIRGEHYYIGDDIICEYCWENNCAEDGITGEVYYSEELTEIYLSPHKEGFSPSDCWRYPVIYAYLDDDYADYTKYFKDGKDSIRECVVYNNYGGYSKYKFVYYEDLAEDGRDFLFDVDETFTEDPLYNEVRPTTYDYRN